jgi:hypothetical protein
MLQSATVKTGTILEIHGRRQAVFKFLEQRLRKVEGLIASQRLNRLVHFVDRGIGLSIDAVCPTRA